MRDIDDALSTKLIKQNQTSYEKAQPKMNVTIARARNTIMDSSYWVVKTIREKPGLGDVSVAPRRQKVTGRPNRIYEIHVDNGIVVTSIREYPDNLKDGFIDQFTLGSGSSVAVAFNGHWERHRNLFRLVTDEKPYISWVDNAGVLWVQHWDDNNTRFQLSSGVSKVRMIRAWKNTVLHYLDQGIVVAYIKTDGKVYYRNFCIQEDHTEQWEYERELTDFTETAVSLNVFITNDYRMGFIIEDSLGKIHWLITPRNWGGMASPAENLITGIKDLKFEVTPIAFYDTYDDEHLTTSVKIDRFYVCPADVVPVITGTKRLSFSDKKTLEVTFNFNLECDLPNLKNTLTVRNSIGQYFTVDSVSQAGKVLTIKTVEEMPFSQNIVVEYSNAGSYYLAFRISNTCLYDYSAPLSLLIEGVPPIGNAEEKLTAVIADTQFAVTQVYYTNVFTNEVVTTGVTDFTFIVTKVGSNPL